MTHTENSPVLFSALGLAKNICAVLEQHKLLTPTPIQHQCIPAVLDGKDVVGIAQTGTGKTLAFGLPMIQQLALNKGQGLILVPTRELASQVDEAIQKVGRSLGLRTVTIIGGEAMNRQIAGLRKNPHIVISTPGRLIDHLKQRNYSLEKLKIIVLDEADRMLDIGFMPQIKEIFAKAPTNRQTLLFSATMPDTIAGIAARFMKFPLRIEVAPSGTAAKNVEQEVFVIDKERKIQLLEKILNDNQGTVLVFSRTKHGAKKIALSIRSMGQSATEIHSNRSLSQRQAAMQGFKTGKFRVLVATDIAARGIDVQNISLVINFDLPDNLDDYVHRIGRTGRASASGKAISFVTPSERFTVRQLERLIKKTIPVISLPVLPPKRQIIAPAVDPRRSNNFKSFKNSGFSQSHSHASRPAFGGNRNSGRRAPYGGR